MILRTEVQRIELELHRSDLSGAALQQKFRSASRADIKLACALRGYFTEGDPFYFPYLQSRIRPAATELILSGRTAELSQLEEQGLFTPALTEEFLMTAINAGIPDSIIWLLKLKERRFGFHPQERTL